MANVLDLRRRIRSVKNTRQITKAMKMVAAAKLRRAQERAIASRPYSAMLASVILSLKRRIEIIDPETGEVRHPLLRTRPEKRILVIVISGDKGFAGAFNANLVRTTANFLRHNEDKEIDLEVIGRRGTNLARRRFPSAKFIENAEEKTRPQRHRTARIEITGEYPDLLQKLTFEHARALGQEVVTRYAHEETDAVYIVYNEFKSVIQQRVVVERILPIIELGKHEIAEAEELPEAELARAGRIALEAGISVLPGEAEADIQQREDEERKFGTAEVDYIYEQPARQIFDDVLPRFITSQLYHAMLESVAAENAARMTAMDAATNNATEMIDRLTLTMNRVRQAAITKEIIEIVSGAAAI